MSLYQKKLIVFYDNFSIHNQTGLSELVSRRLLFGLFASGGLLPIELAGSSTRCGRPSTNRPGDIAVVFVADTLDSLGEPARFPFVWRTGA